MACLKLAGTEHEDIEALTILQRTGSRTARHDFNRVVGMGSNEQHLELDERGDFAVSKNVTRIKL